MEAAKMGITLVEEEEEEDENGLKNRHHDMFAVVSVYTVFQLSLLGSLLSSSNVVQCSSSSWHTPHFYLSLAASLFTLITLVLAYVAEDMQEAAPPSHRKRRAGECFHVAAYPLLIYAYISMH